MSIYEFSDNGIKEVLETTFEENGILERKHLQNHLKENIELISEDTLVISEEFSEWDNSQRSIDLLGIDKNANLVVIELKRTQSGNHMELQAIRYSSMISTMSFQQCVNIYQKYLNSNEDDALKGLLDFLGWDDVLEEEFAPDVRIVLASADFSKELTTSVLWLIDKGIDITCVKIKPYKFGEQIFLDINQIIPLPETESYLIKVKEKSIERKNAIHLQRECMRQNYWKKLLGYFRENKYDRFNSMNPSKTGCLKISCSTVSNCYYELLFNKTSLGINFGMYAIQHEQVFSTLASKKNEIEGIFGETLEWNNTNDKSSKIQFIKNSVDGFNEKEWDNHIKWHFDHIQKLEEAIQPYLELMIAKQ